MGNYHQKEIDFVTRTIALVHQYESIKSKFKFEEQFNHTLIINCLLGLIILPNEKLFSHLPKEKIPLLKTPDQSGINENKFCDKIKDTRDLIIELRKSAAHFNINFISETKENLIDRIQFINDRKGVIIADFKSEELLPFLDWYASVLIINYKRNG